MNKKQASILLRTLIGGCLFYVLFFGFSTYATTPSVVINEIAWMGSSNGGTAIQDANDEWVELYNETSNNVDLSGWTLNATDGTPSITLEGSITSNGYFLLERTNDDSVPSIQANQLYTGALGNGGENLVLYDETSAIVDSVAMSDTWLFGDNITKQTMERTSDGTWQTSADVGGTPKKTNSYPMPTPTPEPETTPPPTTEPTPEPTPQPQQSDTQPDNTPQPISTNKSSNQPTVLESYPSGVIISELLPSPNGSDSKGEWIEIQNTTTQTISLEYWTLEDTEGSTKIFTFPEGSIISPNGFLVLSRPTTGITLNNNSDGITLKHPNNAETSHISYTTAKTGSSYAIIGGTWTWTPTLTPGSHNIAPDPTPSTASNMTKPEKTTFFSNPSKKENNPSIVNLEPQLTAKASDVISSSNSFPYSGLILGSLFVLSLISAGTAWFVQKRSTPVDNEDAEY